MVDNLTESLAHSPWIIWLMLATLAVAGESIERGGWLGRAAIALGAGGVVALAWPSGWWLQWLVALAVLILVGLWAWRRRGDDPAARLRPSDDPGAPRHRGDDPATRRP